MFNIHNILPIYFLSIKKGQSHFGFAPFMAIFFNELLTSSAFAYQIPV